MDRYIQIQGNGEKEINATNIVVQYLISDVYKTIVLYTFSFLKPFAGHVCISPKLIRIMLPPQLKSQGGFSKLTFFMHSCHLQNFHYGNKATTKK